MMLNYMNMGIGQQPDPRMIPQQGFAGPMGGVDQLSLTNPGFQVQPYAQGFDPATGLPINPDMGLPPVAGPNPGLTGWDAVNDKMRYFGQQMQQNRMMRRSMDGAQPGAMSGKGGGGGGFGHMLHAILGHGGAAR